MNIEVGRTYVTGDDCVWFIDMMVESVVYPYKGISGNKIRYFNGKGKYGDQNSRYDIVKEIEIGDALNQLKVLGDRFRLACFEGEWKVVNHDNTILSKGPSPEYVIQMVFNTVKPSKKKVPLKFSDIVPGSIFSSDIKTGWFNADVYMDGIAVGSRFMTYTELMDAGYSVLAPGGTWKYCYNEVE